MLQTTQRKNSHAKLEDTLNEELSCVKSSLEDVKKELEWSETIRVKEFAKENEALKNERVERFGLCWFQGSNRDNI